MWGVLGERANVNPPIILNRNLPYNGESESASSHLDQSKEDSSANDGLTVDDGDGFLTGSTSPVRAKKKRKVRDPNETMKQMLDVFEKKWEDDKEADATTREEENDGRKKILDIMTKGQETMSAVVDVLKVIADKM
jgi:hypothetical protein